MLNTISKFAMAAMLAGTLTVPSYAQSESLKIDSDHSEARFSIDGTINKANQTVTLGAARVSGIVNLDESDLTKSTFAFNLYPATSISPAIDQYGKPASDNSSALTNCTTVSFQSEHVSLTSDGKLQVAGNLSLTSVHRNVELTPNDAYAGPVYGLPILHHVTREVSFVMAVPDLPSAGTERSREIEVSAMLVLNREDFPPLLAAVLDRNWPPVVQDEQCRMSASIGEDYAGASCTGNLVQVPSLSVTYTGTGDDYPGPFASTQLGNKLTIFVHMQLTGEEHQLSAKVNQ